MQRTLLQGSGLVFSRKSIYCRRESAWTDMSRQNSMVEQMVMTTNRNRMICLSLFINYNKPQRLSLHQCKQGSGGRRPSAARKCPGQLIKYNNIEIMSSSDAYSSQQDYGWISWFCSLDDHSFFAKVDEEYIRDSFNLYGLKQMFDHYNDAIEMILKPDPPQEEQLQDQRYISIYQQATDIYGLIHSRYITTPKGLSIMKDKYQKGVFGVCPRVLCERQHVLPVGMSEEIRTSRVKIYCPRCQQVYVPKKKCPDVDGAYFGCSFPNAMLIAFPDLLSYVAQIVYIPRVYGFKVYGLKGSKYEKKNDKKEVTFYTQQQLKKIKSRNEMKPQKKTLKNDD